MKHILEDILQDYLQIFKNEKERQQQLNNYLKNQLDEEVTDWNNFQGHIVASGFVYAKKESKFLVLFHNDLGSFFYPGGHINPEDKNPLVAAKREIYEETGFENLEECIIGGNPLIPIDIDTHVISYNERLELPEHIHFDFRYLFLIDKISSVKLDDKELSNYKWITIQDLYQDKNFGKIAIKLQKLLDEIR